MSDSDSFLYLGVEGRPPNDAVPHWFRLDRLETATLLRCRKKGASRETEAELMSHRHACVILVFCLMFWGALAMPFGSAEARETSVSVQGPDGKVVLATFGPAVVLEGAHAGHLLHMDLKRLLALTSGVALGTFTAQSLVGGQLYLVGLLAGAMVGEWWYNENIWPFHREIKKAVPWWKNW